MSAFTAKNYPITNAPKRITLLGDKVKRPEPAQHIIEFPGGAIEVSRTTEGLYWVHVIVNTGEGFGDGSLRQSARGFVVDSRIDADGVVLPLLMLNAATARQIAVLIRPEAA